MQRISIWRRRVGFEKSRDDIRAVHTARPPSLRHDTCRVLWARRPSNYVCQVFAVLDDRGPAKDTGRVTLFVGYVLPRGKQQAAKLKPVDGFARQQLHEGQRVVGYMYFAFAECL